MTSEEMIWDLSHLVSNNTETASIRRRLDSMTSEAQKIREEYHGKIGALDGNGLLGLLEAKDSLHLSYEGTVEYCLLSYSANSTDEIAKQLNDAARRAIMKTEQALAFIDIELGKLLSEKPQLVNHPELSEYKHYLERILRKVPHMLTEAEEQLVILKDKNGINAWETLQSDWLSTRTFTMEIEGEKKTMPYGEIVGYYQNPNRELRKLANQTVYEGLGKDDIVWASALRAVCEDHIEVGKLRKWASPLTQSLINNDLDEEAVKSLMQTIEKNAGVYRRYLELKAKIMGLPKLANYDLAAPLPSAPDTTYTWTEARKEITASFSEFDAEVGAWIDEMYAKRHLDGEIRKGKTSGAFCSSWLAGKTAYILQSYNSRIRDVYTQAHELGHAIHAYLLSRAQKPSNCEIGSCRAESGSIFGELLLTERLLSKAKTKEEKQAILCTVLDQFGAAAFQVSARYFFEHATYNAIKQGQFLDGETAAKLWVEARDKICGDAIQWLEVMKWEWTKSPHYFMANYRFYNYPYVFGQLFVYALYRLYKEQGKAFVPKLKALLSAGSSKSPRESSAELGLDITSETFWEKGIKQAEEFINMLEETL